MNAELQSDLILIVIGFPPSEIWRWLGIVLGRRLDEQSEIILWVRGVATALIAAVGARIVLIPPVRVRQRAAFGAGRSPRDRLPGVPVHPPFGVRRRAGGRNRARGGGACFWRLTNVA
jgi:hypothetical protein